MFLFEIYLFKAGTTVTFFGAFQRSEVLYLSRADNSRGILLREDLTADTAILTLRQPKADQKARGQRLRLGQVVGLVLCPVLVLEIYINGQPPWAWAFVLPPGQVPAYSYPVPSCISAGAYVSVIVAQGVWPAFFSDRQLPHWQLPHWQLP